MKKFMFVLGAAFAVLMITTPAAFAQGAAAAPVVAGTNWVAISAAFGMALAAFGGAIAQSRVASAACEGMARNPGSADAIRASMILGLVFIETLALLTLVIIFVKV
jgi:F-type H+-transporting ATPase subunit c